MTPKLVLSALVAFVLLGYFLQLRRRRRQSQLAMAHSATNRHLLDGETEAARVKRLRCGAPPRGSFETLVARMPASQRSMILEKVAPLLGIMRDLVASDGVDVGECERRYYFALLNDLYPTEMKGDFTMSDERSIETVCTIIAAGVAVESVVSTKDPAALTRVYPIDERSPVLQTVRKSRAMVTAYKAGLAIGRMGLKD